MLPTIYVLCETFYFCDIALELAWSSCFHGSAFDYYSMASLKHLLMSFQPSHSYCLTHTICLWEKNSKVCLNKDWLSSTVSIASTGISTYSVIASAMLSYVWKDYMYRWRRFFDCLPCSLHAPSRSWAYLSPIAKLVTEKCFRQRWTQVAYTYVVNYITVSTRNFISFHRHGLVRCSYAACSSAIRLAVYRHWVVGCSFLWPHWAPPRRLERAGHSHLLLKNVTTGVRY